MKKSSLNSALSLVVIGVGLYYIFFTSLKTYGIMKILQKIELDPSLVWLSLLPIIFGIFLVITGILGFKLNSKTPEYMLAVGYLLLTIFVTSLIFLGSLLNLFNLTLAAILSLIIIITYNLADIQRMFNLSKKQLINIRLSNKINIVLLFVIFLGYGFIRFVSWPSYNMDPKLMKESWEIKSVLTNNEFSRYEIYDFIIRIPKGMVREESTSDSVIFATLDKSLVVIIVKANLFESMAPLGEALGEEDGYSMGLKVIKEKVGIMVLSVKSLIGPGDFWRIDNVQWKGFIQRKTARYKASIWHKDRKLSLAITIFTKDKIKGRVLLEQIIGSLSLK